MGFGVKLEVWGDLAAFNRPEMKVERVSYDVMTPSAARGILEAIYWKPQMRWVVDEIRVINPIRFTHVRRNEISTKIPLKGSTGAGTAMRAGSGRLGVSIQEVRQQRAAMVLRDVRYGISAHVEVSADESPGSPEAKHLEMFKRRASRGQFFHHPYLGVREFPAYFRLVEAFPPVHEELSGDVSLGFMLHDIEYVESPDGSVVESHRGRRLEAVPRFFQATMRDGVIRIPPLSEGRA
ncbi:MAG: type I-C CRISPR-associated protein Cas5c [Gemmatimonadota bacterium]|nr:type I-C CRISPR-associated protein Cas5c [Gemmatimonadota bacterium]MDH5758895.1 type I-C CRISPR-associated protein Cas5c [Gemmatimonadota bacterium]